MWLKLENTQLSGSFKLRGVMNKLLSLTDEERSRRLVAASTGNHGAAFAHAVANLVGTGVCRWGIVVDGAGIGSCMVANKVPGVRAALAYDLSSARNSREHNHANVLTLGAGLIGEGLARHIVDEWLATPWGPDRHARRVAKITDIENRYLRSGAEK